MDQFEKIENEMNDFGAPKQVKGGVFALTDIELIKDTLRFYVCHNGNITDAEQRQIVNLLHRLNSRA